MADTISASRGPCPLRLRRELLTQQSVSAAQITGSTGISTGHLAGRAHIRAQGGWR